MTDDDVKMTPEERKLLRKLINLDDEDLSIDRSVDYTKPEITNVCSIDGLACIMKEFYTSCSACVIRERYLKEHPNKANRDRE